VAAVQVWIGEPGGTEVAAQVLAGLVGRVDTAVAPGVIVGLAEVVDDIGAGAGGLDAKSGAAEVGVGVGARVWIVAARADRGLVAGWDEFGVARDAVVGWDGFRVVWAASVERVAPAGGCWVLPDGLRAGRDDSFRRGVWPADLAGLQVGRV
jgi:hypothetical protein